MSGTVRRTLLLSFVLPLVAIQLALRSGAAPLVALTVAALFPLIEIGIEFATARRVGIIAAVALVGIVVGVGLALATGNAVFAILKDSAFTFVYGLIFLGSLFTSKPLIYRLNIDLAGTDASARARAIAMWDMPAARRAFGVMTAVWGSGLLLDAVLRVVATFTVPIATATSLSPMISLVVIGALIGWTIMFVRARRGAAAATA